MAKSNEFLGTAPIGKLLFKLSLPAIAAQLVNLLYNLVDRVFIGHIEGSGDLALTGVGVCMSVIIIVSAFACFISSGGAPRASMAMGAGDYEGAEKILGNCFSALVLTSVVITSVLLLFNKPILLAFGASENTISYATEYMNIYAMGTLFVQLTLGLNAFITAQGFATTGMLSVLIGAVCNIILDPILIYGAHLGVRGAALATIISQAISMTWILLFLTGKKTVLHIRAKHFKLQKKIMLPILALGSSAFVMQASESVILICFNSSLLKYGGDVAVGAMTILTSILQFCNLPAQGLGQGAQPISSFNYGANKPERVKKTFKILLGITLSYTLFVWALVMLFPQVFTRIFVPDAALVEYTSNALRIYFIGMGIFGAQITCQMTFTSIGCAKESITVAVMRKFILLIPLIYIIPNFVSDKTMGVFLAEPIADIISVIFTVVLFSRRFKKAIEGMGKSGFNN